MEDIKINGFTFNIGLALHNVGYVIGKCEDYEYYITPEEVELFKAFMIAIEQKCRQSDTQTTKLKELISKYESKLKDCNTRKEFYYSQKNFEGGAYNKNLCTIYEEIISDLKDLIGDK